MYFRAWIVYEWADVCGSTNKLTLQKLRWLPLMFQERKCVLSPSWLEKAPGVYLTTTYSRNDCTYILLKSCKQKIEINKSDLSVFVWRIWRVQPHKTTMFITVYSKIFLNIYFLFMLLNAGHTIRCKKQLKIKEYINLKCTQTRLATQAHARC